MYKPRNVFIHTPKDSRDSRTRRKAAKKSGILAQQTLTGGKMRLSGGFWVRGGWWEGIWGHGDSTGTNSSIPIPQPRNWLGIWGRNFHQISQFCHLCLFPHHLSIISSNSAADWGLGATKNWFIQRFFHMNHTFLLDILLKIWFLGFFSTQPCNQTS